MRRHELTEPISELEHLRALAARLWSPQSRIHAGELTWGRFQVLGREPHWRTAWWEQDGQTLAWGWIASGELMFQVEEAHPGLAARVLDWFDACVDGPKTVTVSETETQLRDALSARGYQPDDTGPFFLHLERDLDDLPAPGTGRFRLRPVHGPADAAARAGVHAAAFTLPGMPPSQVTADSYRVLMEQPPYRPSLDWIAEDVTGQPMAFCLVWWDGVNDRVCVEPVGCHPGHRRRGLAKAVSLAALRAARELGARSARVCARGDAAYPAPRALYGSLGFRPYARDLRYRSE